MKTIVANLNNEPIDIELVPFADVHIGSAKCNYEKVYKYVNYVKNNPNAYAVIVGDLINNSTKNSVGDVFEEQLSPMEQMKTAIAIFEPIKDKILAITAGNHERRSYKQDGTDLDWFFAKSLGLEDKYDYTSVVLFVKTGKVLNGYSHTKCNHETGQMVYTIYLTHGDGNGGRTIGGKANGAARRANIIPSTDVVITAHTHSPMAFYESNMEVDTRHCTVSQHEILNVITGSFLNYEAYAELYGLCPSSDAYPIIVLKGKKKEAGAWLI